MQIAIYARCSSSDQSLKSQLADLTAWAAQQQTSGHTVTWYRDEGKSGTNYDRPGWLALEAEVEAGRIQTVAVWRLDRLGRACGATISLLERFDKLGVSFVSLREGIDSTTPAGRLMRNILSSFAAFETEVRRERQRAGIDAALEDVRAGRRPAWGGRRAGTVVKLTPERQAECRRLKGDGQSVTAIARALNLSRPTVYAALRRQPT